MRSAHSESADMTMPSVDRDLLMDVASRMRFKSPVTPVFSTLSLPSECKNGKNMCTTKVQTNKNRNQISDEESNINQNSTQSFFTYRSHKRMRD